MPKQKTKRGAAKRFKVTASGKILRWRGWKSHLLEWKSPRRKRQLRKATSVSKADRKRIRRLLPYL
jgi:large subunit ribosomal protein L35